MQGNEYCCEGIPDHQCDQDLLYDAIIVTVQTTKSYILPGKNTMIAYGYECVWYQKELYRYCSLTNVLLTGGIVMYLVIGMVYAIIPREANSSSRRLKQYINDNLFKTTILMC